MEVNRAKYPGTVSTYEGKLAELVGKNVKVSPFQDQAVKERLPKFDTKAVYQVISVNPKNNTLNIVKPDEIKSMSARELDIYG